MTQPPRKPLVVVGSCNLDAIVSGLDHPEPGMTVFAENLREEPGGKGLNQALAAARMGAAVTFIGATGEDNAGAHIRRVLEQSDIAIDQMRTCDQQTARAFVIVGRDQENRIIVFSGANNTMGSLAPHERDTIRQGAALILQLELPDSIVTEAAQIAADANVPVALTPAPVRPLSAGLLENVDILFVNEPEACSIAHTTDPAEALENLTTTVTEVIMTRGAQGCDYAHRDGTRLHEPAQRVTAVDTTAAGDTFAGAFMATRLHSADTAYALRRASAAAALTVQRHGTSSAIPWRSDFDR